MQQPSHDVRHIERSFHSDRDVLSPPKEGRSGDTRDTDYHNLERDSRTRLRAEALVGGRLAESWRDGQVESACTGMLGQWKLQDGKIL
jgi:hypothetical protein